MDGTSLSVFTHKDLGSQHLVETRNVDEAEPGSNVPFICKNIQGESPCQYNEITMGNERNTKRMEEYKAKGLLPLLQEKKKNGGDLNLRYPTWSPSQTGQ